MKIDHHLHTTRYSPDSVIDPRALIDRARAVGLDGVVITEHDAQWTPDELAEIGRLAAPLRFFSGVEVSAREGHFLVYGLPDLDEIGPGIEVKDLLAVVARHQAAIVAAHPFRWDQPFTEIIAEHGPAFDALELVSNNITRETRSRTRDLLRKHAMGATGSSDGHALVDVGCYYTEFDTEIGSMADFVSAIRSGRGQPRHRVGATLTSGPIAWPED